MKRDQDLLFGAMALLTGLIDFDQLKQVCDLWSTGHSSTLPDILCEKGWLASPDRESLDHLVERRLSRCGGDLRASFTGYPYEVRSLLDRFGGETVHPGLAYATLAYEGGEPGGGAGTGPGPRYALDKLHAAGGIGEIWLARDTDLHRDVAVKRLQPRQSSSLTARARFLREARITGKLDHPGVVPVYEICSDEASGEPYYAMRFLKGQPLSEVVARYHRERSAGDASLQTLLELLGGFCVVCNTVAYAHSKGIVHRDLKCDNVILGDFGEVIVIDWGLAKEVGTGEESTQGHDDDLASAQPAATQAGHVLGTPAYMAPEQAAGQLDLVGPSTDIYGLCAILYEILCGQAPFSGENVLEVMRRVREDPPIRPSLIAPGVPDALEQICLKGLAKNPAERHPSADQLAKAIQTWVGELAERKQAEEERERFFALSLDLLAIIDREGRFRQVSPAWERLLGHDRESLVGRLFADVIHPDDRSAAVSRVSTGPGHTDSATFEVRVLARDGSYRWVSWNGTPIAKEQCTYAVGRDVTDLKRSQQLFEGLMQSAPDALVIVNRNGRIALVNRQLERLFGYQQDELLGQALEILVPERFREQHPSHVAAFFAKASFRPMGAGLSLLGSHKDGREIPVEISLSSIATEDGPLVAASVRESCSREPSASGVAAHDPNRREEKP